jgi:hypothetical protein
VESQEQERQMEQVHELVQERLERGLSYRRRWDRCRTLCRQEVLRIFSKEVL